MANIFDYLRWRGDLTLEQAPFQAVDGLILSCLAYTYFDEVFKENPKRQVRLADALTELQNLHESKWRVRDRQDVELIKLAAKAPRFREMKLCYYIDHIDLERVAQFSAITIKVDATHVFVAFRGTDTALVGWKEDFHMTFLDVVPAQIAAKKYLENIALRTESQIFVGGHSKGGNLAVFAATNLPEELQGKIEFVYNYDGPGVRDATLLLKGHQRVVDRIETYVPQGSVIGLVFEHQEDYAVIHSTQKGLLQHDPYSWEVLGNDFVRLDELEESSLIVNKALMAWLNGLTIEQREKFVDALFELLETFYVDEAGDLVYTTKNPIKTLKSLHEEDAEMKEILFKGLKMFLKATGEIFDSYRGQLYKKAERRFMKKENE